jgi:hypothetical protein
LQVDGLDQAEPNGPFGWGRLPDVKAEKWVTGRHFDLFIGSHDGYCRSGSKIIHRRHVFSLKSKFWLVRDVVLGTGEHRLDLCWHLAPGVSMRESCSNTFVEDAGRALRIFTVDGHGWSEQIEQGWCAPAYGCKIPASVLRFSTVTKLPAEFVTLLSTSTWTDRDNTVPHLRQVSLQDDMRAYQFETADEAHSMFFASGGQPWRCGVWTSDAEFLHFCTARDEEFQALTLCQGSLAELTGQSIISSSTPIERCELRVEGQQIDMFSSDSGVRVNTDAFGLLQTDPDRVLTNALPDSGRGNS